MQIPLTPYGINITELYLALMSVPNKRIAKCRKIEFRTKLVETLSKRFDVSEIDEILKNEKPVYLSYIRDSDNFIYWMSLKLSIVLKSEIQAILNYASLSYQKFDFKEIVLQEIYPTLEKNWIWTTKSNLEEVFDWIVWTIDVFKSIFFPEVIELIFHEFDSKLVDENEQNNLFMLIYFDCPPISPLVMNCKNMKELCLIFSILKRKNKVKTSKRELAVWIKKNFVVKKSDGKHVSASIGSIITYLDSNPQVPEHMKAWL